ncbi:secreted RxLR effector protein 161-like [Trifolium pratense]|uniref:secreted RxLR effector protein 161-like n=1 Tax=Trifolium pratense TaxID=57577 RepID=UPI001E6967DE|nr:secreted RxLR effector protein 161-like [Trifolium pratense]
MGEFESSMKEKFAMIDLGKMKDFLGVEVNQTQQGIFIHQQKYAYEILSMFGMGDCNEVCSPIVPGCKLVKDERATRPNMTFSMCLAARYMDRPTEMHIDAVKRVLRYLKCTMSYGVLYKNNSEKKLNLVGWTYSNYAGDYDDRKSTSGYVFTMGTGLFLSPRRNNLLSLCQPLSQSLWPLHHVRVKECV